MALSGTVQDNKGLTLGFQPLLLVAITLQGTSTPLLLSTHALDGTDGPSFPGIGDMPAGNYLGRLSQQDIGPLQWRSELGIDRVSKFAIHIIDDDAYIYNNYCKVYGFRGASMIAGLVEWEAATNRFTSNCKIKFRGVCDMERPTQGMTTIVVSANTGHNLGVIKLPSFPHQSRCPLYFPKNAAERALAVKASSDWCPYAPDQGGVGNVGPANHTNSYGDQVTDGSGYFIMCDYLRSNPDDATSGCMARLGNAATTSVAPDGDIAHDQAGRHTGAFAGIQWSPGTYYQIVKNYVSNSKFPAFSFLNSSILGQFATLLYGEQMVTAKSANIVESGNDTKSEAIVCTGDIGQAYLTVIVNGIMLNRAPSGDPNLWWDYNNTGGRFGNPNTDTGYRNNSYSALGDPYGSMCCIRTVFYKDIFTGFGAPTIRVIAPGPSLWVYAPIASASGDGSHVTVTFPAGNANPWIGGSGIVEVFGCSLSGANGQFTATNAVFGPPGTVTYACSATGTGTGGYIGAISSGVKSNPAMVLVDVLKRCRYTLSEINLATFYSMALWCYQSINYVDQRGNATAHSRYSCKFALERQRSASEVVAGILRGFNAYTYYDEVTGQLCLDIARTLADSQPAPVPGSNDNTPYTSIHVDGSPGTGYVAFSFDESNIVRIGEGDKERMDIEWLENATILTPNQIFAEFQDEDNQYSQDSLGQVDTEAMARAGGALQPGGALVPESLLVLGPPNFDQMVRVANTYLAERQYGNEDNTPKGTRIAEIGVTVEVEHLRGGHLVHLNLQLIGLSHQLFRVLKVQPSTDFEAARVTIQWENEIWRTDVYGQQPQAFHSNAATNRPTRVPLPWQPDAEQPDSTLRPASDRGFTITEVDTVQGDGTILVQAKVSGKEPITQIVALCQPPLVPMQGTVATVGGSIPGGFTYLVQICAKDANGDYSTPSNIVSVVVPSGTNTNTITVDKLGWGPNTSGYDVFVGTDSLGITYQASGSGTPSSITLTSVPNVRRYGPPDLAADSVELVGKVVTHAGIVGSLVAARTAGPNTVTIGSPATGSLGSMAGRKLMLLGRPNLDGSPLPIVDFDIVSNSGSVLTVDRDPTSLLNVGDVVVISGQPTAVTDTSLTDSKLINAFATTGVSTSDTGKMLRVIEGTGKHQLRMIKSVTESTPGGGYDTYGISHPWDVQPDSTSIYIVEEPDFKYNSSLTPITPNAYQITDVATLNLTNLRNVCMLIQALTVDPTGTMFSNTYRSPFRLIWLFGVQGTRVITANIGGGVTDVDQLKTDGTVLFDTTNGDIVYHCLSYVDVPNVRITWRKISSDAHTATILGAPGELLSNGASSVVLSSIGDSLTGAFDGN